MYRRKGLLVLYGRELSSLMISDIDNLVFFIDTMFGLWATVYNVVINNAVANGYQIYAMGLKQNVDKYIQNSQEYITYLRRRTLAKFSEKINFKLPVQVSLRLILSKHIFSQD